MIEHAKWIAPAGEFTAGNWSLEWKKIKNQQG